MNIQTTEGLLVYSPEEDAYYLFPRDVMERARVSAEHRASIEVAIAETSDVSCFLLTSGVSTTPTAQTLAQQSINTLQQVLTSAPLRPETLSAGFLQGLIGVWPTR